MLIIQGPLSNKFGLDLHKQRNIEAGTIFAIPIDSQYNIFPGSCQMSFIGGRFVSFQWKVGEIRPNKLSDWGKGAKIHFEDEDMKPIPFDKKHVRIVPI